MEEKQTKQLNIAISAVFIIAALVLVWMAASRQSNDQADQTGSATTTAAAPTNEYDGLKGMTKVGLAAQLESWTPNAAIMADKQISKRLMVKGTVAQAYLLVQASEGENALTKWDSIFFKLNDAGGHLFRPMTLATPKGEGTTVLYDLKDVPVLPSVPYDENRTPEHANLLETLKDGHSVLATSFISSLRQSTLAEVSLYYSCAAGSECSVTLK
jgi:hypothetical protein